MLEVAPGSALQELSVAGSTLQPGCLEAVARCTQQLTKLDVSYNALVSDGTLRAVAMCCGKLKTLKASGCRGIGGDSLARSLSAPGFTGLHQITISHAKLLGAHLVALLAALPHLRILRVSNCHGLKGIIGATDSYASSCSTNAKWAATVRPQPVDHETRLTTQQVQQQHTNGDTASDNTTNNSGAVVTFSETTTPEQRQRRQLSMSSDIDSDAANSNGATAAAGTAGVASPDENSEHDCGDTAVDTSDELQCDAEAEQQARDFDCYVNSRLVPLTGKKGRGSVMFSSSYSAVQNAAVQAAAALLGLSYSDTDNGAKVSAAANSSDSSSSDANGSSSSSQQQQRGSKQKRRDAWGVSDAANDANSSTANGSSNAHNSSDSTATGSSSSNGAAVATVNARFLQNIEVVADARSLKKLEQLAGLLPRERGGTKRVICLRYQKGVCNRRPLDCEWAHFQGNLQKIGRFKPLLDLVHMVEGSKKGSAKARRPRSDSFGEAASAAAAVLAGNSSSSSGNQSSSDVSGNAALQSGGDGTGSSGSRSRGGSVSSNTLVHIHLSLFGIAQGGNCVTLVLGLHLLLTDATTAAHPMGISIIQQVLAVQLNDVVVVKSTLTICAFALEGLVGVESPFLMKLAITNCRNFVALDIAAIRLTQIDLTASSALTGFELRGKSMANVQLLEICGAAADDGAKSRQQFPGGKRDAMNSDHFSKNRQRTIPLKNLEKGRPKLTVVRTKNQLASRKA
eukprot:3764-Heterococcus_DN1.PRE.1